MNLQIILDSDSDFIKFKTNWINKSQNHILKVVFNHKNPVTKTVSDDLLDVISRKFDPNYDISNHIPAPKGIELRTNTAPMQTFVETQGVAAITKGLNEYEVSENTLSITILRSTDVISNPKNPARGTPAGPPIKTPDLLCLKENSAEFALTFNKSIDKIKACQQSYYGCTIAFWGDIKPIKLLNLKDEFVDAKYDKKLCVRTYAKKKLVDDIN